MNVVELVVAIVLVLLGVRSVVVWAGRRFDSQSMHDHVLFALFVAGRAGAWFGLAGLFFGYAFVKDDATVRPLVIVPIALAALSVLCSWALGRGN
jgi:hypothetical protein